MKQLTLALLFAAACGDNIHPPGKEFTDVSVDPEPEDKAPDEDPPIACDAGVAPDAALDASVPDSGSDVPDAGIDASVPDAGLPECEDSHIDLNGHEHKCQHDQDLPDRP